MKRTKVFFCTEITGLHKQTTLISIACVTEHGKEFYAEFTDYNKSQVDEWIQDNVINSLHYPDGMSHDIIRRQDKTHCYGATGEIRTHLEKWLAEIGETEFWSDRLSYNWVLFCDIWGHAFDVPKSVYYLPFDICTMFKLAGTDPDISREKFAGLRNTEPLHNSLWNAHIIKNCYEKLGIQTVEKCS